MPGSCSFLEIILTILRIRSMLRMRSDITGRNDNNTKRVVCILYLKSKSRLFCRIYPLRKGKTKMLSKTSIVIMGMLGKGEMNAYDMLKMIEKMNMRYWFPIGATTLYETCIRLKKKEYIINTGESDKKAIYQLTEAGLKELKSSICTLFERVDFDSVWFCLAVMYSSVLSKKELEREIGIRTKLLDEYEKGTLENKEIMLKYDVSYIEVCAIDRMLQIIQMEKETLNIFSKQSI